MTNFDGKSVLKGFLPEYRAFIRENLTPEMLNFPAPSFYSKWYDLDLEGRKTFWVAVIEATATLECGLDRTQMFREPGQRSSVTGLQNISEGLMQMSYGDPGCSDLFLYAQDKKDFLEDFALFRGKQSILSQHPDRTTLNPYRNLLAAIRTFTRLAKAAGPKPPFKQVFGKYWSTIRDSKIDSTFRRLMDAALVTAPIEGEHPDLKGVVPLVPYNAAMDYLQTHEQAFPNKDSVTVIDFTQHSGKRRMYIVNMKTGGVETHAVAHGRGSDPSNSGFATKFSNIPGSYMSSLGVYRTDETYISKNYRCRLDGLSDTNSNARSRYVVLHGANYVDDSNARQGRSEGCPAVQMSLSHDIIDRLKGGSLLYAWHKDLSKGE